MTIKTAQLVRIRLRIPELYLIPDAKLRQSIRVDFKDESGWLAGCIKRSPSPRQLRIHHYSLRIDPDDSQVHKNKKHMDGCIDPALVYLID
jgi:hypothetical protein